MPSVCGFMESLSQLRIGTAGWSYKDWEGIFYPPGLHPLANRGNGAYFRRNYPSHGR
jgi:hypothetical protein